MGDRRYRDEEWLRVQYVEEEKSTFEIAEMCGCNHSTVSNWLNRYEFDIRGREGGRKYPRLQDQEWLHDQYINQEKSAHEIADERDFHHNTVLNWLHRHDIKTRDIGGNSDVRYKDYEWLRGQYVEKEKSTNEIAVECGTTPSTINRWLHRHQIEVRGYGGNGDIQYQDYDWLYDQYVEKEKSTSEIADGYGFSRQTVSDWLQRHGIETRGGGGGKKKPWATYYTHGPYPTFKSRSRGESIKVKIHQLLAIAEGADPHKVFSGGDYHVHHKNGIPWDNRPENIELLSVAEHAAHHRREEAQS